MDKQLLKEIVLEQSNFALNKLNDKIIERETLQNIKKYLKLPHTVIIAGIRRVGKSTLLAQIMSNFPKNGFYYFNFEDERLVNFCENDFNRLYEVLVELYGQKKVFFLDEIQNVSRWENFIRRMQDKGFKFFITGSNASLLSKELGTKLTGRHIVLELYPFSFKEFLQFKNYNFTKSDFLQTEKRAKIKRLFNEYLKEGGMPEYLQYKKREILKNIYDDILYRDIVARYELKEIKALRELGLYLLTNIASIFSYNKLKNYLSLGSVNTVKSYIHYLENSFLVFELNQYSNSVKQQIMNLKKIYSIDNALTNEISFTFSKDKGKFLENFVFQELKRRGEDIYFYRDKNNLEVDFMLREGRKIKALIQVTYELNDQNKDREIKSLLAALKNLCLKEGLILTDNYEKEIKIENKKIKFLPVYKWLLDN